MSLLQYSASDGVIELRSLVLRGGRGVFGMFGFVPCLRRLTGAICAFIFLEALTRPVWTATLVVHEAQLAIGYASESRE